MTGDPRARIQSVWVTYTGDRIRAVAVHPTSTPVPGNPNLYTGSIPSGRRDSGKIRFIVQAVNGAGLVGLADNLGAYNRVFDAAATTATVPTNARPRPDPDRLAASASTGRPL